MSVPISFGLPLIALGIALVVAGINGDRGAFLLAGVLVLAAGLEVVLGEAPPRLGIDRIGPAKP